MAAIVWRSSPASDGAAPTPPQGGSLLDGVYDEDDVKVGGEWKIAECRLQFMWPNRETTEGYPGPFPPTAR